MKMTTNKITPNPDFLLDGIEARLQQLESRQQAQQALVSKPKFAIGDRVVSTRDAEGDYVGLVTGLEGDHVLVVFGDELERRIPVNGVERPADRR